MPNDDPNDSWHYPKSKGGKLWVNTTRNIYHPVGFKKGYNFPLFLICAGIMMGFTASKIMYLNFDGIFLKVSPAPWLLGRNAILHNGFSANLDKFSQQKTIPGDATHYLSGYRRIGMMLHLATVIPAGFLACFQFVPVIRYKLMIFHRLNGYLVIILFLVANSGVYMVASMTAGGAPATQALTGMLAAATTISIVLAYINIKRLQIDQHRNWMLRTWFYAASIITLRFIMMLANMYITDHPEEGFYSVQTCALIWNQYVLYGAPDGPGNPTPQIYPQCLNATSAVVVAVPASIDGPGPENITATFHLTFGMSGWIAFTIHAIAVELYLALTPAETERLRQVSYERQLKAGLRNPGRAGLTVDKLGDAPAWRRLNNNDAVEMDQDHH